MKILITGATGFIGFHLTIAAIAAKAKHPDLRLRVTGRDATSPFLSLKEDQPDYLQITDMDRGVDWDQAVAGCDMVVHLAGAPASLPGKNADARLMRINRDASLALASKAAQAGVRRFLYVSSLKACGNERDRVYRADETPKPEDLYGQSKREAEKGLALIAEETSMDLVILRPAMVFGANGEGNFQKLARLVSKGFPLPFASIENKRSMILVDDLCRLIVAILLKPDFTSGTYMVAHREAISTPALIKATARGLGRSPQVWPFPPHLLELASRLFGVRPIMNRLTGSYLLDASPLYDELGLSESAALEQQIEDVAKAMAKDL